MLATTTLNAAAALAAVTALAPHRTATDFAEGLASFAGLPHRLERVVVPHFPNNGFWNDSKATTAEAVALAIAAVREKGPVRLIAGGKGKGTDLRCAISSGSASRRTLGKSERSCTHEVRGVHAVTLEAVTAATAELSLGERFFCPLATSWDQFEVRTKGRGFQNAGAAVLKGIAQQKSARPGVRGNGIPPECLPCRSRTNRAFKPNQIRRGAPCRTFAGRGTTNTARSQDRTPRCGGRTSSRSSRCDPPMISPIPGAAAMAATVFVVVQSHVKVSGVIHHHHRSTHQLLGEVPLVLGLQIHAPRDREFKLHALGHRGFKCLMASV